MKPAPQISVGGWMSDRNIGSSFSAPQKAGIKNAQEVEQLISKKLVQPVSINGQLNGCLQGFLAASSSGGQQTSVGNASVLIREQKIVAYAADITLHPEGLRKGATNGLIPALIPSQNNSCAIESGVEWSKRFSYPLLCALQQVLIFRINRSKADNIIGWYRNLPLMQPVILCSYLFPLFTLRQMQCHLYCNVLQRQVSYMTIAVYSAGTIIAATAAASKSGKQNILGIARLDMSSFIGADGTPQIFLIPVRSQKRRNRGIGSDLVGWLVMGLQYFPLNAGISPTILPSTELETKCGAAWLSILLDPFVVTGGLFGGNSEFGPKSRGTFPMSAMNPPATRSKLSPDAVAVHIALGPLELTAAVISDVKESYDEILLLLIRVGDDNDVTKSTTKQTNLPVLTNASSADVDISLGSAVGVINSSGLSEWEVADITVSCLTNIIFTPVVYFSLYRGKRISKDQIDGSSMTLVGEAVVILSRVSLTLGSPINMMTPLRDSDGQRTAILQLGAQKTSLLPPTIATGTEVINRVPSMDKLDRQTVNSSSAEPHSFIALSLCLEEGSVIDSFWRQPIEPFFEFTLLPPKGNIQMPKGAVSQARTGFIGRNTASSKKTTYNQQNNESTQNQSQRQRQSRSNLLQQPSLSTEKSPWGLVASLLLPKLGFPVGPADEMGCAIWGLAIVCRDASREGCPEIASARVGLPWSLLARGRATDQWVVLFNTLANATNDGQPGTMSLGIDMAMRNGNEGPSGGQDSLAASGRVRLKMTSRSVLDNHQGQQLALMSSAEKWTGTTAFQQFQSQYPFGNNCTNQISTGSHTLVRSASHPGIGASLIWLRGLAKVRSGHETEAMAVTMASVTSLVAPVLSQSVYGDFYHELDDGKDDIERLTFSEVAFGRHGNSSINYDGSCTNGSSWGEDWMGDIPGLDGLCGSLPVAGGHSELRLGVSVQYNKIPYTACFSVLSGLTPCGGPSYSDPDCRQGPLGLVTPDTLLIPALDILVSSNDDDVGPSGSNDNGRRTFPQDLRSSIRSVPRLKFWTSFVPFVRGRLTICCRSIRFSPSAQQNRRSNDGSAHQCSLRFTMSTESFGYTPPFDIPLDTDTAVTMHTIPSSNSMGQNDFGAFRGPSMVLSKAASTPKVRPQGGQNGANDPTQIPGRRRGIPVRDTSASGFAVTLPIDTLELTTRGGSCSMLTLQLTLIDMNETGTQYCLGDGGMQTASLYYQALRASSASPPSSDYRSNKSDPIGASPWMLVETPIYDRIKHVPVAWVTLSSRFMMEGMSAQVASALQAARCPVTGPYDDTITNGRGGEIVDMNTNTFNDDEEMHIIDPSTPIEKNAISNATADRARTELGLKQAFNGADTDHSGSISIEEVS